MKILIVDHDEVHSKFLREGLSREGFCVDRASQGPQGLEMAESKTYDVILMGDGTAEMDGHAVVRKLRSRKSRAAILIVSSKDREGDKVEGFSSGADDYLVKPVTLPELVARIRAILRRMGGGDGVMGDSILLRAGPLQLHLLNHEVRRQGKLLYLTKTEFTLLECLIRRPGQVLTRSVLGEHIDSGDWHVSANLIDVHIKNIRTKIDGVTDHRRRLRHRTADRRAPKSLIRTVRGMGYALGC